MLSTLLLVVLGVGLYSFVLGGYRLLFHPLAKFPGPKVAAITHWYEVYWDIVKKGEYFWRIQEMHAKYGRTGVIAEEE